MPPILSKVKKRKLVGQSREIVSNVMNFMAKEALASDFIIPVQKVQIRTAAATGVSVRVLYNIKKELAKIERGEKGSFTTPDTSREKSRTVTGLNEFDKCIVRRTIHEFYVKEKCGPTLNKLKEMLQQSIGFKGCTTSLRSVLKELGFTSTRTKYGNKFLIENLKIRSQRIMYLKRLKHYREKSHPIVFTGEIFLTGHDCSKRCTANCDKRIFCPLNGGHQMIIVHAGGTGGFLPNACHMWAFYKSDGQTNENMNWSKYMKWAESNLLPNLKPNSVIVIDSATYHNAQTEKTPTCNSSREDMIQWLVKHNIPYSPNMLKPELYELVRLHKIEDDRYVFDELLKQHGHIVLRLPRFHSDLNAIALISAKLKVWLAQQNRTYGIEELATECEKWSNSVSEDEWLQMCSYVETIEKEYTDNEVIVDKETEKILISQGGQLSDNDEDPADRSTSDEYSDSEKEEDSDDEFSCHSTIRPPFELVECGEEPTMGYEEQVPPVSQSSILESILEKPKATGRKANRASSEKKRKRKEEKAAAAAATQTTNGDVTSHDSNVETLSSVDATQLKTEMQEALNKRLRVEHQNNDVVVGGSGASGSTSSEQFAEVLIKEEVMLVDAPMAKNVFGEEEELPIVEIKQESSIEDEYNPLDAAATMEEN